MIRKIQNRQKLKTQRLKILRQGKHLLLELLLFQSISNNQEYVKSPSAVTFPKGKSPNHPKILHVQVANNQVRIPQEKRGYIKMPVSCYHGDKLLWGTFNLKPDLDFCRFKRENTHQE